MDFEDIPQVDPNEAYRLVREEGYVYLDVRTPEEFAAGHPAGAVLVPVLFRRPEGSYPNPRFVDEVKEKIPPGTSLVIGCRSGARSMTACRLLRQAGYPTVYNVRGGFAGKRDPWTGQLIEPGWQTLGLPVEEGD